MLLSNLGMDLAVAWKTGDEWGENPPVCVGKPQMRADMINKGFTAQ